jgi:hypothetical protein
MTSGGIEKRIKIINVNKNIFDIQTANEFEIHAAFERDKYKDDFISIAKKLQKVPFLYNTIDINLSDTILLRNLLNIPSVYPIISKKREGSIYTRSPCRVHVIQGDEIYAVPEEYQLYVIGLSINISKQGLFYTDTRKGTYIVPEYLDSFESKNGYMTIQFNEKNTRQALLDLTKQIRYASRYYNSTALVNYIREEYALQSAEQSAKQNKTSALQSAEQSKTSAVVAWYSDKCVKDIKLLLGDTHDWTYNLSPLQALGNDIDQLLYITTEGADSEKVKQYVTMRTMEINKTKELTQIEKNSLKRMNVAKRYLIIIEKKFGSAIYRRILLNMSKGRHLRLPGGSMAVPTLLPNIVDPKLLLGNLTKEQQEIVKTEYNRQENYYAAYKSNKCSHVPIYRRLIRSKNVRQTETYIKSLKEYFTSVQASVNGYHMCKECKFPIICSHVYGKLSDEINNVPITTINANLYKFTIKIKVNDSSIYYCKYCSEQLLKDITLDDIEIKRKSVPLSDEEMDIRSYIWSVVINIVKTTNVGNEKAVIAYIANSIRPLVMNIVDFNTFDNNVKFKIILYCYAYALKIIKEQKVPFFGLDFESPTSKIAEKLLSILNDRYKILIKDLNITLSSIRNEFITAFKSITNLGTIPVSNSEIELANFIINIDPIYRYAKLICILFKKIPSANLNVSTLTGVQLKKEFETIMGTSVPTIVKQAKNSAKNPEFANIVNNRLGFSLPVEDLDYFYKIPELNTYSNIVKIENENTIIKDFMDGKHENIMYVSYVMFCMYITQLYSKEDHSEFRKKLLTIKEIEDKIKNKVILPVYNIYSQHNSHFIKREIQLTRQYDENGNKHKWNIWWYGDKSYKVPPGNKDTILSDIECSVCGIKLSEISKLDITKTTNAVNAMADLNAFYTFYKIRCPTGDLHNWSFDTCTKCTLTISMIDDVNINKIDNNTLNYYNKYLHIFKNIKKEVIKEENKSIANLVVTKFDFAWNYTMVVKISQLFKLDTNIILSIGLTEGRTFKEVENGNNIPDIQLFNIYSAYSELLYILNRCSNIEVTYDYAGAFGYLLYNQSYDLTHKFIIQSICELILLIRDSKESIANDSLRSILNRQKLLCVPLVKSSVVDSDDAGIYLGDDVGDISEEITIMQRHKSSNYKSSFKYIDFDYSEYKDSNSAARESDTDYIYWSEESMRT